MPSNDGASSRDNDDKNPSDPDWRLYLDEIEERHFSHSATGYGVEVYGGTPEARETILRERFDEPVVVVVGRNATSEEELVKAALVEMGAEEEDLESRYNIGSIDLRRALIESESNFIINEFDAMDQEVQTGVARMMKGITEGMDRTDAEIMVGFACEEGGAVVRAERDLSMRIRSFEVTPGNDDYDPLAAFEEGDMIDTSARKTPMEVDEVEPTPQSTTTLTVKNHHGRYRLRSHTNGSISMRGLNSKGKLIDGDVEVNHVE